MRAPGWKGPFGLGGRDGRRRRAAKRAAVSKRYRPTRPRDEIAGRTESSVRALDRPRPGVTIGL